MLVDEPVELTTLQDGAARRHAIPAYPELAEIHETDCQLFVEKAVDCPANYLTARDAQLMGDFGRAAGSADVLAYLFGV
jgi:hypothetical protein